MIFIKSLIFILCVLLIIAFFTLWERKIFGYIQYRKGPNLVGFIGILQPIADGVKLLLKTPSMIFYKKTPYTLAPLMFFFLGICIWYPMFCYNITSNNNFLLVLIISSCSALSVFFCGWSSSNKFSLLGGVRASAQMISYEVVFSFGFFFFLIFYFNLSFSEENIMPWSSLKFFLLGLLGLMLIIVLAETNRTPFDLTEGESELVSGFNTEFSSVQFVLLFLGEYAFICFFSFLLSKLIFLYFSFFWMFLFIIVWTRAAFPRKRYDLLMLMMWIWFFPFFCSFLCWEMTFLLI